MYHEYPYTTYFHDIDKLCRACHDAGYKLLVDANALKLLNKNDEVVSTVVIHYAETALSDVDGKALKAYIFNASTDTDELILTKGDGTTLSLTIPFATKAEKDKLNKDLTNYVYEVQASGDKIQIVKGDSTVTEITVPFATKALTDTNGKDIKTYAATMAVDGDYIVLKDSNNSELARLTAPYAIKAFGDDDGDTFTTTYAATLEAGTTTVILKAKDGNTLSTITVPYATKASTDINGNNFISDYAETIVVDGDGKRIGLEAHDGTRLATITVPFATLATDATNAVETISVVGDQLVFTTYGGQSYSITAPYAVKAQKDDAGNTIKSTYVASVTNDASTGKLTFKDALGQTIVEITPTVSKATYDSYNNLIADYVKSILASASSDYVTVTHGDGDTEQITINYSTHAWKDTNENVIKNTYIKRLACVEDVQDHHYKLVAYNGDTPEAELFRIELIAYEAQRAIGDKNGVDITTYVHDVTIDASTKEVVVKDGTNIEKARFKAGGTQLKYYDQGTLTDIDEAELGTGLEYDDTTDTINCTVEPGTKIFSPDPGTPTHSIEVLNCSSIEWNAMIQIGTASDLVLDGTAATDFSDYSTFVNSLAPGDLIAIDLSAISVQVDAELSSSSAFAIASTNWDYVVDVTSGFNYANFVAAGYTAILRVNSIGSQGANCTLLAASSMYTQLSIGDGITVENNVLKSTRNGFYITEWDESTVDSDGFLRGLTMSDAKLKSMNAGDILRISSTNYFYRGQLGSKLNGVNGTLCANTDITIRKTYRDLTHSHLWYDKWELIEKPSIITVPADFYTSDVDETNIADFLSKIATYTSDSVNISSNPLYNFYNGSTKLTPDKVEIVQNDFLRVEAHIFSSAPTYTSIKRSEDTIFTPTLISCDNSAPELFYNVCPVYGTSADTYAPINTTNLSNTILLIVYKL